MQDLLNYNTFGFEAKCSELIQVHQVSDIFDVLNTHWYSDLKVIGGGSNILLTKDVPYTILLNKIKGIEIIEENSKSIIVKVGGGEIWTDFVSWSISNGYGGLENLSLIPGSVGAAPMQNIGAYGVEQDSCFVSLEAINLEKAQLEIFDKVSCQFGYRSSIFKTIHKDKYFITHVIYTLNKEVYHTLNLQYAALPDYIQKHNIQNLNIRKISDIVSTIRRSKLPNPNEIGNAGSFFKNPIITKSQFTDLWLSYPDMPHYPSGDEIKVPAGWLIEKCGLKGLRRGNVGIYDKQALVLVHYNRGGSGEQIRRLAEEIIHEVYCKFKISLEPEVNIW